MIILTVAELGATAIVIFAVVALALILADHGRKLLLQFGLDLIQLYAGWKQAGLDVEIKQAQLDDYERKLLTGGRE